MKEERLVSLGKLLFDRYADQNFVKEVLLALENEGEMIELEKVVVEENGLVQAEVYDLLSHITNGRFVI